MKLPERWLREWIDAPVDREALAAQLTMLGLTVDAVETLAAEFTGVVVGRVQSVEPLVGTDKLRVCQVSDGGAAMHTVVCGAPNVRAGLTVAFARPGASLPGGRRIEVATVRGVVSYGMLCSEIELGLSAERAGLIELGPDLVPGTDLAVALDLPDAVFDIDVTPNRGDCLSIAGLARELALRNRRPVRAPRAVTIEPQCQDSLPLEIRAADACTLYTGRVIRGVDANTGSPAWLRERLRRCGVRPINPVVDVTNYVMLECGQPLHAFDLARLQGGIEVRRAAPGERVVLLDGQTLELIPQALVIADAVGAVALAGVMGGAASGVTAATVDIFLESAHFTPAAVAQYARALHLQTDASQRFERGVSPALAEIALERATELIVGICGGRAGPLRRAGQATARANAITLRGARLRRLLGFDVPAVEVERILTGLGMQVTVCAAGWQVQPPPARFDLTLEVDLVEEVARHVGYDNVPPMRARVDARIEARPESHQSADTLRTVLIERGYFEAITYTFVDPQRLRGVDPHAAPLALANPISSELSVMRTSLWPGLLQVIEYNTKRQTSRVRVFELGAVFRTHADGNEEMPMLAGAITGALQPPQWGERARGVDFFDLKADVEALLGGLGPVRFQVADHPALQPGQGATVHLDDRKIGYCGAAHPHLLRTLGVDPPVYLFELRHDLISYRQVPVFKSLSRFPSVRRDVSFQIDRTVPAAAVLDSARRLAGSLLVDLELFDVYAGEGIDSGKKSVALGLIFQDASATLMDERVNPIVDVVVAGLQRLHGAVLRS